MTTPDRVLACAAAELGTSESPANSNRTKYGAWFGLDGQPWCMMFVQWVFHQAGDDLPCRTASCSGLLNWYRRCRPDRVVSDPAPGDIVIYSFGHTGIVESAGSGTISAIEGNTSPGTAGSQANGGMVCRKTRQTSSVTAYIRPDYNSSPEQKEVSVLDNVPGPAHREGVRWAVENGILAGNQSGDLALSRPVTRQQLCTILLRFARLLGKTDLPSEAHDAQ